ncbi:Protein of unknown function [Bacillus cereus]|nr:Protein of unknown function [Bacillus cereus]
MESGIYTAPEL